MNQIVALTIDLQILLVAGYLAYKTSIVGKTNTDRSEDFLFKVLAYGLVASGMAYALRELVRLHPFSVHIPDEVVFLVNGSAAIIFGIASAIMWRAIFSKLYSRFMNKLNVYSDDHYSSTWDTICESSAKWDCVQIHLSNGLILESHFSKISDDLPIHGITLNSDGIAIYVTRVIRADDSCICFEMNGINDYNPITYVPREQVRQIDISWKAKPSVGGGGAGRPRLHFLRLPWWQGGRSSGH